MSKEVTEAVVAKIETPAELVREEELQQSNSLVERRAKELKILTNGNFQRGIASGIPEVQGWKAYGELGKQAMHHD